MDTLIVSNFKYSLLAALPIMHFSALQLPPVVCARSNAEKGPRQLERELI